MRRLAALLLLLACGSPAEPQPPPAEPYPTEGELPVSAARFHFDDGSVRLGPGLTGGRGVSLLDVDDDGWPDATVTWAEGVRLLRGSAEGFRPWTEVALPWPRALAWADIDDDGDRDLYVSGSQTEHRLLRNDAGGLTDITAAAGLPAEFPSGGEAASFGDLDGDGDLDLFVALGARSQASIARDRANGVKVEAGSFGAPDQLYWNEGGVFRRDTSGVFDGPPGGETFQACLFDGDGDGDLDLFAVDDHLPDRLLVNEGAARFADRSTDLLPDEGRLVTSIMGIDLADFDQDGRLDLYGSQKQGDLLYLGNDLTAPVANHFQSFSGGADATNQTTGWGAALQDFDHDGDQDLLRTANFDTTFNTGGSLGRVGVNLLFEHVRTEREIPSVDPEGRALVDRSAEAGPVFDRPIDGWGLATGDIDRDGDLDVLIGVDGSHEGLDGEPDALREAVLLVNRGAESARRRSVLVRLRQPGRKNAFAVGASAEVLGQGIRNRRVNQVGQSYLSQHDDALHFGLGDYLAAPAVVVTWPGGAQTAFLAVPAGAWRLDRPAQDSANCCIFKDGAVSCTAAPSIPACLKAQAFALGLEAVCDAACDAWAGCCPAVAAESCRTACAEGPPPESALECVAGSACSGVPACLADGRYAPGNPTGAATVGGDACPLR